MENEIMEPIKFLDYIIKLSGDGIVIVDKNGCNAMPGACQFGPYPTKEAIDEAKKSALILFMINRPMDFEGSLYWRLTGSGGAYHEWFMFKQVLKNENIPIPEELKYPADGINFSIGFNGKKV